MSPGETILEFDLGNHLWIVVSFPTASDEVALVNLTTHGRGSRCGASCVTIDMGERPYVTRLSCVHYSGALMHAVAPLERARERGELRQHQPLGGELLRRIQEGALSSPAIIDRVRDAVRASV